MKKRISSKEEITNDPSLRWNPYLKGETIWSDEHRTAVRFLRYESETMICVASMNGFAPLPGAVHHLRVRRTSEMVETRKALSLESKRIIQYALESRRG